MLSPSDLVFESPFYAEAAPPGFERASNPLLFDQVYQFIPWRHLAWRTLRDGTLPVWNSQSQLGKPFLATMQAAVLYPINLLTLPLSFERGFVWSAIIRLWLAGVATYFLVRCYSIARLPAVVSATSFALCGFLVVWLGHPHTNVAVLLPGALLCVEIVLRSDNATRRHLASLALSLVLAAQFLGGHPETIVHCLVTTALYGIIRTLVPAQRGLRAPRRALQRAGLLLGALALGASLAAVQLAPFLEWLRVSNELAARSARPFVWLHPDLLNHVLTLPLAVFPNLYGNPTWPHPYWSFPLRWGNYNEHVLYVGVVAFVFAIVAVVFGWRRHRAETLLWVIIASVSLGRALHLPVIDWFNQLPILGLGWADRLRLVAALSVSVLAGIGVHVLLHESDRWRRASAAAIRVCAAIAVGGALLLIVSNVVLPRASSSLAQRGYASALADYSSRDTHAHPLDFYYRQVDAMVAGIVAAFRPTNVAMYSSSLVALALLILFLWWQRRAAPDAGRSPLGGALLLLVLADLGYFGSRYNPTIRIADLYPRTASVERLASSPPGNRVLVLRQDLIPDAGMMVPFADIRGLDYPTRWYAEYVASVPEAIPWLAYGSFFETARSPLLRVLGARNVVSARRDDLSSDPGLSLPEALGGVFVAPVTRPWPRANVVHAVDAAADDAQVLEMLRKHPERVLDGAVVNVRELTAAGYDLGDLPKAQGRGSVRPDSYTDGRSVWRVETDSAGLMVVSDSFYPGWRAFVDGAPHPVLRVNHALQGVLIPAGATTVELRYEPASVKFGLLVTALGAFVFVALAIAALRSST